MLMALRKLIYRQLDPKVRLEGRLTFANKLIVFLVIISLLTFALETEPTLPQIWQDGVFTANYIILVFFAVEYVLRVWTAGENPAYAGIEGRLRYIWTPYSVADFIAFFPELLVLLFFPQFLDSDGIMVLRLLRLARLLKIARLIPAFDILAKALSRAGSQLAVAIALALGLVFISAVALFFIEGSITGQEAGFGSIPRAIWWAVATLTTVGYGDVFPVTPLGRFAAGIIALAGVGVVALPTGILASAFSDELRERDRSKDKDTS